MTRESRIVEILRQSPGLSSDEIQQKLVGQYRFQLWGMLVEFSKVNAALINLEKAGRIWSTWTDETENFPRRRSYFAK